MIRVRWRRALAAVLLCSLLHGGAPPAARAGEMTAEPRMLTEAEAVAALQAYGIVSSLPLSQMRLDDPVTRAEMARMLASVLRLTPDDTAPSPFSDTRGHWGESWIAALKAVGLASGYPDGTFRPDAPVSYAEVITFLLRITGRAAETATNWYSGAVTEAVMLRWIPPDMDLSRGWTAPATRRDAFRLIAIATGQRPQKGSPQSLLHDAHDQEPPALALDPLPPVTRSASVTVSGTAAGAIAGEVRLGTEVHRLTLGAGGTFRTTVRLPDSSRYTLTVTVVDGAGNEASTQVSLTHDPDVRLVLSSERIATGVDAAFALSAFWESGGRRVPADVTWEFDPEAFALQSGGQFKARLPGRYRITARSGTETASAEIEVAGPPARLEIQVDYPTLPAGGAPTPVRIRVLDETGMVNPTVKGQISLTTTPSGAGKFNVSGVQPKDGTAVAYLSPGTVLTGFGIQAKLGNLVSDIVPIHVEERRPAAIRLETVPAALPGNAGRPVEIHATLLDQVGVPVPAPEDITVRVRSDDLTWTARDILIRKGSASSASGGSPARAVTRGEDALIVAEAPGITAQPAHLYLPASGGGALARLAVDVIHEVAPADGIHAAIIAVHRLDQDGKPTESDMRPLVLVASSANVSVRRISAPGATEWYAVRSGTAGKVTVTAGVPGDSAYNSAPAVLTFVAPAAQPRVVLRTDAQGIIAGDRIAVYAELLDARGIPMPNPGPALVVDLSTAGGALEDAEVVIPPGADRSGAAVLDIPQGTGKSAVSVTVHGKAGSKAAEVLRVSAKPAPADSTPDRQKEKIRLAAVPDVVRDPVAGEYTRIAVRAETDSGTASGTHAFAVRVRLNGREITAPPDSLTVTIGGQSVFGNLFRTTAGKADVWIHYTGAGTVEIEPVPRAATSLAYDSNGIRGYAKDSTGSEVKPGSVTYQPGPLDHLALEMTAQFGSSPLAVFPAGVGRNTTVILTPADRYGNPVLDSCEVTLSQVSADPAGVLLIRTADGDVTAASRRTGSGESASFVVAQAAPSSAATSTWTATAVCGAGTVTAGPLTIAVTQENPPVPRILRAGGDHTGTGSVTAKDSSLAVVLEQTPAAPPHGVEMWLYRGSDLIGRYGPVYPDQADESARTVLVPLDDLPSGSYSLSLQVRLHSGAALSQPSPSYHVYAAGLP